MTTMTEGARPSVPGDALTNTIGQGDQPSAARGRRRWFMLAGAAAFAATDLIAKALAEAHLPGTVVDLQVLQLQLAHNSGVAFSLGEHLPSWTVIAATAAITVVLAGYAWRAAPTAGRLQRLAGAAILGGASANLIDRVGDGVVTDYLHTGWWPTFNLADTLLMLGMATVILTMLRDPVPIETTAAGADQKN